MKRLLLFLFAVLLITLFSTCSFIYPLNSWDDSNVYMTIGNAMLSGRELYVDIFDHKGPVLFFMHEAAALLSRSSFIGIYFVEVFCCYFFLLYSLKTMRLFASGSYLFPLTLLLGVITYSSDFFGYGDCVEEFSLPVLAHSLYYMLRYAKDNQVPSRWHSVIIGIGMALLFWMKFNLMFFYLGAVLALLFIGWKHQELNRLGNVFHWALGGFAVVTAFVLAYFAINGTLDALWEAYFMVNIFHYNGVTANGEPDFWWFPFVKLGIWVVLMVPVVLLRVRWEVKMLVFGAYGLLVLSYATLTVQFYYFLTIFAFFPLLTALFKPSSKIELSPLKGGMLWFVVALFATATNFNLVTLLNGTYPQKVLEMAEIINANESEDSEVLTFSSYDTGIYQHTRHLPPNKNFFISSILDPDIKAEQAKLVASGQIKYLVREIEAVNTCHEYYDAPIPDNYHLIYDEEELFRYRFIWQPLGYLWNLTWPRPLLKHIMEPVTLNQRMLIYERRP